MKGNFSKLILAGTCVLAFGISSCSNDEPKNPGGPTGGTDIENDFSDLVLPKYSDVSGKFTLDSNPEGIEYIELTESGDYIVYVGSNYSYSRENKKEKSIVKHLIGKALERSLASSPATRYGYGLNYGKYTKIGANEYELEGFGKVTITQDQYNNVEVVCTPEGGTSFTVGGQKEAIYSLDDPATLALCRSWRASKWRVRYVINGQVASDREDYYSNYSKMMSEMEKDLYEFMKKNYGAWMDDEDEDDYDYDDDYYYDEEMEYPLSAVFTKSGSYLVEFSNQMMDVRQWKWTDIENRYLLFSYNLEDDLDYEGNWSQATFSGKKAILYTSNRESEMGLTLELHSWETLEEKY